MTATFRRRAVAAAARSRSDIKTFPAPVRGWVTHANLAGAKPQQALVLENFFPTQTSIQPRGGRTKHATIGTAPVERVFPYLSAAGIGKLFAADATKIFDITSPASTTVPPAASVTGQTSGYYSTSMMVTSGGSYLFVVNGADFLQRYDGTAWLQVTGVSADAITGTATNLLSHVWTFRNRLFFVIRDTQTIGYLAIDSISGALGVKSLYGIFIRGGSILFGATWSRDAGNGMDDFCVIVTTEGEMAIFAGNNPAGSAAGDFDLVGRYDLSRPLGKNATMQAGGDLVIACEDGIVPVSEAITKDSAALSLSAVSRAIEPDWQMLVRERRGTPWEMSKWASRNMAIVSMPAPNDAAAKICLVVNVETGAWAKYTAWDVRSLEVVNDQLYFGDRNGVIWKGEDGGSDNGGTIYCTYVGHADHLGSAGVTKTVVMARSTFVASVPFNPKLSVSTDYITVIPAPPSVVSITGEGWDLSVWDTDVWDAAAPTPTAATQWVAIGRTGFAINPQVQVSSNSLAPLDIKLVAMDLLWETGGITV